MSVTVHLSTVLALAAFGAGSLRAQEALPNGGFEDGDAGPAGWTYAIWSSRPSRGALEWATEAHSGVRAAKLVGLENAVKEPVRVLVSSPPIEVAPKLYKLRGWYRTQGDARAHLQIPMYAEDFAKLRFRTPARDTIYRDLPPSETWAPFEFDVNVKPGVRQIVLLLRASDVGAVWYDDVSFVAVEAPLLLKLYAAEYGRGNVVPLVRGAPNFMRLMLIGDRKRIKGPAEIVLDLPEGTGDFGLLGGGAPVVREGRNCTRFRVPIAPETLSQLRKTLSHCSITVWLDAADAPAEGAMFCRPVLDGQPLPEKQARIRVLPPFPSGPRPRRFHTLFCWSLFSTVPEVLRPAVYDMMRQMGVDHHLVYREPAGWAGYFTSRLKADGGTLWANIPHKYTKPLRQEGWETRVTTAGKGFFDLDDGHLRRLAPHVDGVFWDWEPANAMHNPLWDHAATVAEFAKKEGLAPETLTEERLKGEFREKFLEFRTWQLGQVMRLWGEYIHDLRPDLTIAICQGSGMPPDRNVDYKSYNDIPRVVHLPMIYTSSSMSFARNVAGLRQYLPNAELFPMTCAGMVADSGWLASKPPRAIYFDYVNCALLGCLGCSHWPNLDRGFDMEYVWEVSRAMRDIARVESYLFDGDRDPAGVVVEPLPESEARIKTATGEVLIVAPQWDKFALAFSFQLKDGLLAAVSNTHPEKPATVRVRAPDLAGAARFAYDPVTRVALLPAAGEVWGQAELARGIMYEAPAATLGMIVLAPARPPGGFSGTLREATVRNRFEARRRAAAAAGSIAALREGDLEINWADLDGDGNAEVRLASPLQELGLGPSGNLWSWKVRGCAADLVNRFDGGGACQDQFWWPEAARASQDKHGEYELVTREIKGGRATVAFRRALSHWALGGLILEKSYSIAADAPRIEVRVTVRNESPQPHEFSYWSHNCFRAGAVPTLALTTAEGARTFSGEQQPREIWTRRSGLPAAQTDLLEAANAPELREPKFVLGAAPGPQLIIETERGPLLQLYRWWDGTTRGRYTLEWMYQRQTLSTNQVWTSRFSVAARASGAPSE